MADMTPADSAVYWRDTLLVQLEDRAHHMGVLDQYYCGEHPLPFLTKSHESKARDEFRQLLRDSRANFMRLVVDATEERLRVEGFRLSPETDATADGPSWKIWQANDMDANSQTAFVEALVKGVSYLSVWLPDGSEYPTIAVEDPIQTIVGYVPGTNYRERAAALKVWSDYTENVRYANVYMPDAIYKYEAPVSRYDSQAPGTVWVTPPPAQFERPRWEQIDEVRNPTGIVPIVPLRNRPRLLVEGESEIADLVPLQNSINGLLMLRQTAAYFGAHRQRWMVGGELQYDEKGRVIEPFNVAVDRLWTDENPEVKFGEFDATDLGGYSKAIEQEVMHISVLSRTPRHYLMAEGQSPSGDAIQSAESGLVKKVERKQRFFGEALEDTMSLALRFAGEGEPPVDSEIVWADPQSESLAVTTDAVIKQYAEGLIPWEAALEKLGYTQVQIQRYSTMRTRDALLKSITNPPAPLPATNTGPTEVA